MVQVFLSHQPERVDFSRAPALSFVLVSDDAVYVAGYRIRVDFDDGLSKTIDFTEWLRGPIFEPLRDKRTFKKFYLDGSSIAWPNGADIAPETLYDAKVVEGGRSKRIDGAPSARRSR